jgi:hypothetical protein
MSAMFRFFPAAAQCNADEQIFIFAPEVKRTAPRMKAQMQQRSLHGSPGIARKQKVSQSFQADLPGPVLREKRILFARDPNQSYNSRHPGPQEGRIAIVTDVGSGMRWTRKRRHAMRIAGRTLQVCERSARVRRRAQLRTAKPCGPGTRGWCQAGGGLQSSTGRCEPPIRRRWRQKEFVSGESAA